MFSNHITNAVVIYMVIKEQHQGNCAKAQHPDGLCVQGSTPLGMRA